jgi:hypothetical protein
MGPAHGRRPEATLRQRNGSAAGCGLGTRRASAEAGVAFADVDAFPLVAVPLVTH